MARLVEILAKNLAQWPLTTAFFCQDEGGTIYPWRQAPRFADGRWNDYLESQDSLDMNVTAPSIFSDLAVDYRTTRVTKLMWSAQRHMAIVAGEADFEKLRGELNPFDWAARIREIDATVDLLEEERVALVQYLQDTGLMLYEATAKVVPPAPTNMWNYENWLPGDLIQMVSKINEDNDCWTVGNRYVVREVHGGWVRVNADDRGQPNGWVASQFVWHSRPVLHTEA